MTSKATFEIVQNETVHNIPSASTISLNCCNHQEPHLYL